MSSSKPWILALTIAAGLTAGGYAQQEPPPEAPPAVGLDAEELQRLRDEVARLMTLADRLQSIETELATAQRQVQALERENADLRSRLTAAMQRLGIDPAADAAPKSAAQPRAEIPEDPMLSPASLMAELRRQYFEAFPDPLPEGAEQRAAQLAAIEQWTRKAARELRGRPTWIVRFTDLTERPDGRFEAKMQVVEESSGLPIGDAFVTEIPRAYVSRVREAEFDRWKLTLGFDAAPKFNGERLDPGIFNSPPFIGPGAEFGFTLNWRGLSGVRPEAPEPAEPSGVQPATPGRPR